MYSTVHVGQMVGSSTKLPPLVLATYRAICMHHTTNLKVQKNDWVSHDTNQAFFCWAFRTSKAVENAQAGQA